MTEEIPVRYVLGQRLDATSYELATEQIMDWARGRESRYACITNVHVVMEGHDDPSFRKIINEGDLVTPDGMPLVWALKLFGVSTATRVYGPDLTLHVCRAAAENKLPIALYGGTSESLEVFEAFLSKEFPGVEVACAIAPPFRPLTEEEDLRYTQEIEASGARVLFVGIGCPKQERWMAEHRGRINMPMLGVGAAFDFHTGRVKQAPSWMQKSGLEWAFRFMMEPRRLWRRYVIHNPRYLFFLMLQYLKGKDSALSPRSV